MAHLKLVAKDLRQTFPQERLQKYIELFESAENIDDHEEHHIFRQELVDFGEVHNVKFVYFIKRIDKDRFIYIIDNDLEEPVTPLDTSVLYRLLRVALDSGTVQIYGLGEYEERWQGLMMAFAPYEDADGNFTFAAGADIDDYPIMAMQKDIMFLYIVQIIVVFVTFFCGILALVLFRKKADQSERSSTAKSNFFATISHEIRTPLNSILGLTEIELNNAELPSQTNKHLKQIQLSSNQLLKIINEIVDLSKIDTKKFMLTQTEYDSGSMINDIITSGLIKYSGRSTELKINVSKHIPNSLFGDTSCINKIVGCMLSNAFKYTVEGSVTIYFDFEKQNQNYGTLIISVEDTGIGIKEENIKRLTEYCSQIDAKANRQFEGLGIGLTISMKLAKLMKGIITVESNFGKGSRFTLRIPQVILSQNELGEKLADALAKFSYKDIGKKKSMLDKYYMPYGKVLVVDDVQTNLDVAKGYMSIYGLQIDCVLSGREAIEKIRKQDVTYDCIFMDHMMPEMDGIEALKKIRSEIGTDYAKKIPIIAFTANASEGCEKMFLKCGFDDFMSKPIDSDKLDKVLNKFIREKQNEQTLQDAEKKRISILESKERNCDPAADILKNSNIDGVDLAETLKKFSDNSDAYFLAIQSFIKHVGKSVDNIKEVSPQNIKEYSISIHGIKGSCYGIGAKNCGDSAKELEMAAKSGNFDEILLKNGDFVKKVEKIINSLQILTATIEELKAKSDERNIVSKPSEKLLADLLRAAKDYNIQEMDIAMTALSANKYQEQDDLVKELSELVRDFRYDDIVTKLKDLI